MKKIALVLILIISGLNVHSQNNVKQVKEYATIYLKVFYQGNFIKYERKGVSKSPIMTLVNGNSYFLENRDDPKEVKKFTNLSEILNYMAKFGWVLKSSNMMPYEGDDGNNSKSSIINTNEYMQILILEREYKEEKD